MHRQKNWTRNSVNTDRDIKNLSRPGALTAALNAQEHLDHEDHHSPFVERILDPSIQRRNVALIRRDRETLSIRVPRSWPCPWRRLGAR
jgi:hypothetical protein